MKLFELAPVGFNPGISWSIGESVSVRAKGLAFVLPCAAVMRGVSDGLSVVSISQAFLCDVLVFPCAGVMHGMSDRLFAVSISQALLDRG